MYVLAGSRKTDLSSNEASMKYFLMGSFATGILLFGIALIYGASGSFHLEAISKYLSDKTFVDPIFYVGTGLVVIGLAFKISAVPFHFWTPDVYQGAPTIITTFMATAVKTAAFAAFFRLFAYSFPGLNVKITTLISVIAASTILVGNITAVYQNNVKRMLAYSSIAHAGYMLLAIVAINHLSPSSVMLYAAAYSLATIASFSVLFLVLQQKGDESLDSFRGMAKSNPFIAFVTVVSMLSLAGIPPTAGFFAKYYIFSTALKEGHVILVLLAVIGSLIGVYYYFKVIIAMFQQGESDVKIELSTGFRTVLLISVILTIFIGIFPNLLIGLI
jgi:NADH-quinone oxidoreductase subunit N